MIFFVDTAGQVTLRIKAKATDCPRIDAAFLAEERRALGERWFTQEYECEFMDMAGAVFNGDEIEHMFSRPVEAVPFPD
jgi:hypothetical protein